MDIPFYHSPTFKAAHQREQATALIQSQLGVGTALGRFPCLAFVRCLWPLPSGLVMSLPAPPSCHTMLPRLGRSAVGRFVLCTWIG